MTRSSRIGWDAVLARPCVREALARQREDHERQAMGRGVRAATPKRQSVKRAKASGPVTEANLPWTFTITGQPRTKNTGRSPRRGVVIPSAPYRRWFHSAIGQVQWIRASESVRGTATRPVHVAAIFYRARNVGDLDRYLVGLGDLLQRSGLLLNDNLIASWDGSRLDMDKKRPRIDVTIRSA